MREEEGGAVLLVMILILPLSLLAALGMYSAMADLMIFARMKRERQVFYAAGEALEEVLEVLGDPAASPLPEEAFLPPWERGPFPVGRGLSGRREFRWSVDYLADPRDLDGDPLTTVVLFNRSFGYEDSPFERGGYPVFHVEVLALHGESRKAVAADVTPLAANPAVEASWRAGGSLVLHGEVTVSGRDHDAGGNLLPDRSRDLPALLAGGPVTLAGGALTAGADGGRDHLPPLSGDPLDILHTGGFLSDLSALPPPPGDGPLVGMIYTDGTYGGPLDGEGILVVHNPRFLPGPFEASRLFFEEGVVTEDFDPAYSHLDPACQPASLDLLEGGTYRGIVVADEVASILDRTVIVGGLFTLSRTAVRVEARAPLDILYSRESLERAGRGALSLRLGFKAHAAPSPRLSGG